MPFLGSRHASNGTPHATLERRQLLAAYSTLTKPCSCTSFCFLPAGPSSAADKQKLRWRRSSRGVTAFTLLPLAGQVRRWYIYVLCCLATTRTLPHGSLSSTVVCLPRVLTIFFLFTMLLDVFCALFWSLFFHLLLSKSFTSPTCGHVHRLTAQVHVRLHAVQRSST